MFTGLIEEIGSVQYNFNNSIKISRPKLWDNLKSGDSISLNGICLSVTMLDKAFMSFDYSPETARITNISRLQRRSLVNLERAMLVNSRFDGHIVQGHVDTTAVVRYLKRVSNFYELILVLKDKGAVVNKGSIAVNGVSLTVNIVRNKIIKIILIPETIKRTNIGRLKQGDIVNIEFDILGKYARSFING